jgi:hypothetical protein
MKRFATLCHPARAFVPNGLRWQALRQGSTARHRMFADHIKERPDSGDPLDPNSSMCLCGSHHS